VEHLKVLEECRERGPGWYRVACPLCGGREARPILQAPDFINRIPGEFGIERCVACGFAYTNPRPVGEALAAFYPDSAPYYAPGRPRARLEAEVLEGPAATALRDQFGYGGRPAVRRLRGRGRTLARRGFPFCDRAPGRLLEIGCGAGEYLCQVRALGWEVEGVEYNAAAAARAREQYGLPVRTGDAAEVELPAGAFDVVVLRMVLEHLPSPIDSLRRLHGLLRPGGSLIVVVPNFGAAERHLFGSAAYFLHMPTHLSHFTPGTLDRALEETGFTPVRRLCYSAANDFLGSWRNLKTARGWSLDGAAGRALEKTAWRLWRLAMRGLGAGARQTVYAVRG